MVLLKVDMILSGLLLYTNHVLVRYIFEKRLSNTFTGVERTLENMVEYKYTVVCNEILRYSVMRKHTDATCANKYRQSEGMRRCGERSGLLWLLSISVCLRQRYIIVYCYSCLSNLI